MAQLQRLREDHADAVLAFELANRAYFAGSSAIAVNRPRAATSALRELWRRAHDAYGLDRLTAQTHLTNHASRGVLEKTGFAVTGTCVVAGRPGIRYALDLPSPR